MFGHVSVRVFHAHNTAIFNILECADRFLPVDVAGHGELVGIHAGVVVKVSALNKSAEIADDRRCFFAKGHVRVSKVPAADSRIAVK